MGLKLRSSSVHFCLPAWTRFGSVGPELRQQVTVANRCTLVIWVCSPVSRNFWSFGQKPVDQTVGHHSLHRKVAPRVVVALATKPLAVGWWSGLSLLTASAVDSVATGSLSSETALDCAPRVAYALRCHPACLMAPPGLSLPKGQQQLPRTLALRGLRT